MTETATAAVPDGIVCAVPVAAANVAVVLSAAVVVAVVLAAADIVGAVLYSVVADPAAVAAHHAACLLYTSPSPRD